MDRVWITSISIAALYIIGLGFFIRRVLQRRKKGEKTDKYWVYCYIGAGIAAVYLIVRLLI